MALGLVSFSMLAVLGLLPVGLNSVRESVAYLGEAAIARQLRSEIEQMPLAVTTGGATANAVSSLGAALFTLVAIVTGSPAALERAPVHHYRRGFFGAFLEQSHHGTQVVRHRLEAPCTRPTLGLLLDGCPRRQIIRQHPPRTARARTSAGR